MLSSPLSSPVLCVGLCSRRWLRCSKSRYHDWCCSSSHWLWKRFDQSLLIVDFL